MHQKDQLVIQAPAKINLYLKIVGRRSDGYHDLETLMQKINIYDVLSLCKIPKGILLDCPDSDLPENEENLVYKAAQLFFDTVELDSGVAITLEKKIPVAAGLGGGSSDAAAVLTGLNRLYGAELPEEKLMDLARQLGADVPFFVSDLPAVWATGIGDCLQKTENYWMGWIVLVNPDFPVSTKWVYQNFALTMHGNPYMLGREKKYAGKDFLCDGLKDNQLFNDLESVTVKKYPAIKAIKKEMLALGAADALMSGSGPSVFGLFNEEKPAQICLDVMSRQYGKKVFLTKTYRDE